MPKKPSKLGSKIKKRAKRIRPAREPNWGGPEEEGVSQSMLGGYICCKERFRVWTIEGLAPVNKFVPAREYGTLWHEAEEELAATGKFTGESVKKKAIEFAKRYKMQQEDVNKWYRVCMMHFPLYMKYWQDHPDVKNRVPLYQEEKFAVPYTLPSGRTVILRGKWDAVDYIKNEGIFLQENKSKSRVDEKTLKQQLQFDMQTMIYLIALRERLKQKLVVGAVNYGSPRPRPIKGVRYNVIRRPLSGGKGSIRPHKATKKKPAETTDQFFDRLRNVILEDQDYFFARWKVDVDEADILRFEVECLWPILENLCDDYEWWKYCVENRVNEFNHGIRFHRFQHHLPRHFRLPYGVYNAILEGGSGELDHYLTTGSTLGLERCQNYFPELD